MVVVVLLVFIAVVVLYFSLHTVLERMVHKHISTQLQAIAVLAGFALFAHDNLFWVAALLLSVVRFPVYVSPINSIADSLAVLARRDIAGDSAS